MVDGFGVVVRGRSCCFGKVVRRWDGVEDGREDEGVL
jgi:hypothetical protein